MSHRSHVRVVQAVASVHADLWNPNAVSLVSAATTSIVFDHGAIVQRLTQRPDSPSIEDKPGRIPGDLAEV